MLRGIQLSLHNPHRPGPRHRISRHSLRYSRLGNDGQIAAELFSGHDGKLLRKGAFPIVTGQLHVRAIRCTRFVIYSHN
jgi:hypothetical protein